MIFGLRPYPSYKASGVLWLGEVPEHWQVLPNRSLFTEVRESGCPEEQLLSVTIRDGVVPQASLLRDSSKKDSSRQDKSAYKVVRTGDIAYNKMRAWQGAVGVSRYQGIVSPAYVVERSREGANPQYFHYLFRTPSFVKEAERWSYGITSDMWSLRPEHFRVIYSCVPPPPEQAAIVRFLEHVDRRISRYIRTKGKLIALLEEQKEATIHQAVTGQVDVRTGQPYPAYKDSGVAWIDAVPQHWMVAALRHRYTQCLGKMLDTKKITGEALVPYLRNVDVQWDRINVGDLPFMDIYPQEQSRYTLEAGDLLVCEGGEVGRCAIWQGELECCGFQKALHRLRPLRRHEDSPRFLLYALWTAESRGAFRDGHQSTIGHLTGDKLRSHRFAFPSIREQLDIENYVDQTRRKVDVLVADQRSLIEALRDFRRRLIADVITGKCDVREAATAVPDFDPKAAQEDTHPALGVDSTSNGHDLGTTADEA